MEARMVNIYEALSVRVTSAKNLEFTLTCRKVVYHLRASNEADLQRMVDGLKREIELLFCRAKGYVSIML